MRCCVRQIFDERMQLHRENAVDNAKTTMYYNNREKTIAYDNEFENSA